MGAKPFLTTGLVAAEGVALVDDGPDTSSSSPSYILTELWGRAKLLIPRQGRVGCFVGVCVEKRLWASPLAVWVIRDKLYTKASKMYIGVGFACR